MTKQYIVRKGSIDCGHRVLNEWSSCVRPHGHTYVYELMFEFTQSEEIGYALDFKEIKRVGVEWLLDTMDHGMLLNFKDDTMIEAVKKVNGRLWIMSLNREGEYCNPTAENISKEMFLAMEILFGSHKHNLRIFKIVLWETPNCFTECIAESISDEERKNWTAVRGKEVAAYAKEKGIMEYDDRKL